MPAPLQPCTIGSSPVIITGRHAHCSWCGALTRAGPGPQGCPGPQRGGHARPRPPDAPCVDACPGRWPQHRPRCAGEAWVQARCRGRACCGAVPSGRQQVARRLPTPRAGGPATAYRPGKRGRRDERGTVKSRPATGAHTTGETAAHTSHCTQVRCQQQQRCDDPGPCAPRPSPLTRSCKVRHQSAAAATTATSGCYPHPRGRHSRASSMRCPPITPPPLACSTPPPASQASQAPPPPPHLSAVSGLDCLSRFSFFDLSLCFLCFLCFFFSLSDLWRLWSPPSPPRSSSDSASPRPGLGPSAEPGLASPLASSSLDASGSYLSPSRTALRRGTDRHTGKQAKPDTREPKFGTSPAQSHSTGLKRGLQGVHRGPFLLGTHAHGAGEQQSLMACRRQMLSGGTDRSDRPVWPRKPSRAGRRSHRAAVAAASQGFHTQHCFARHRARHGAGACRPLHTIKGCETQAGGVIFFVVSSSHPGSRCGPSIPVADQHACTPKSGVLW